MGRRLGAVVAFTAVFVFIAAVAALLVAAPPVTVALASGGAESGAAGTPLEAYRPVAGLLWGAAGVIGLIFAIGSLPQWRSRS